MVAKHQVLAALKETGAVAVLRTENPTDLVEVSRALAAGGVKFVEITMTVPGALEVIHKAVGELKGTEVYIGAGTVLDSETARAAIIAGSQFVVGPVFDPGVVRVCSTYGVACMPGALTPTEVVNAWKGGADVVKIFPGDIGGPDYIKALREPLPQVELLPTKGVNFDTVGAFIKAGAIAVGAGTCLVSKAMIAAKEFDKVSENAQRFIKIIRDARGS